MLDHLWFVSLFGLVTLAAPAVLLCALGFFSLIQKQLSERATARLCQCATLTGLAAALGMLAIMLLHNTREEPLELGHWVVIPHYHFSFKLVFDRLSVPLVILTFLLSGVVSAFAAHYMHREPGYNRFFALFAVFVLGMVLASLAGTIETLFAGWELVGLSSALLVAFFHERPAPSRNGLRVWVVYRISDAALLLAAIMMHHWRGEGDFARLLTGIWPEEHSTVEGGSAMVVGFLLIIAAAGKSALVPFSGWLPRAMEGPTTSSAIFYGALSVHLGAFLLLRVSPILETSLWLSGTVVTLGLLTAVYAYFVGSVQTDIKSALAFASLAQVGLIVAEIGFGWRYVALVHLLGNACLRTLQFLRAPTVLHDYHLLENAIGHHLPKAGSPLRHIGREGIMNRAYRFALERGYLDAFLSRFIVTPFVRFFQWCDGLERRWTCLLSGGAARESDLVKPHTGTIEDLS